MRRLTFATLIGTTLLAGSALAQRDDAADTNTIIIEPTYPGWTIPTYPGHPTRPPVSPDPGYRDDGGERVVIRNFENSGRVRKNRRSTFFRTDDRRTVESIDVRWTDNREDARGRLIVESQRGTELLVERDVSTPGRVTWNVGTRISGFQIEARRDDLWIEQITVNFGDRAAQRPTQPTRPLPGRTTISSPTRIFGGRGEGLRVREDTVSPVFQVPGSGVHVGRIRVVWTDDGGEAEGRLIVQGRGGSHFPSRDVRSPGQVIWDVNGPINAVQIAAEDDDLWVREIWLEP